MLPAPSLRIAASLALVLVLAPSMLCAQQSVGAARRDSVTVPLGAPLMGDVIDAVGRPMEGVEVLLTGTGLTTRTDRRGFWIFPNPPAGPAVLAARLLGYAPVTRPVNLLAGVPDTIPLIMRRLPRTLSTVQVRAQYDGAFVDATVMAERLSQLRVNAGRLYTRDEILRMQPQSVVDLLVGVPGVSAKRDLAGAISVTTKRLGTGAMSIKDEPCPFQFYINRSAVDIEQVAAMSPLQFHSVEVYPITTMLSGLPFIGGRCGAVVISTF